MVHLESGRIILSANGKIRVRDTKKAGDSLWEVRGHLPPLLSPRGVVPGLATRCELWSVITKRPPLCISDNDDRDFG